MVRVMSVVHCIIVLVIVGASYVSGNRTFARAKNICPGEIETVKFNTVVRVMSVVHCIIVLFVLQGGRSLLPQHVTPPQNAN